MSAMAHALMRECEGAQELVHHLAQATSQQEAVWQTPVTVTAPFPSEPRPIVVAQTPQLERQGRGARGSVALADYEEDVQACLRRLNTLEEEAAARERERREAEQRRTEARRAAVEARDAAAPGAGGAGVAADAGVMRAAGAVLEGSPGLSSPALLIENHGAMEADYEDVRLRDTLMQTVKEYRKLMSKMEADAASRAREQHDLTAQLSHCERQRDGLERQVREAKEAEKNWADKMHKAKEDEQKMALENERMLQAARQKEQDRLAEIALLEQLKKSVESAHDTLMEREETARVLEEDLQTSRGNLVDCRASLLAAGLCLNPQRRAQFRL